MYLLYIYIYIHIYNIIVNIFVTLFAYANNLTKILVQNMH